MGISIAYIIGQGVKDFRKKYKYIKVFTGKGLDVLVSGDWRCVCLPRRRYGFCSSSSSEDPGLTGRRFQKRH